MKATLKVILLYCEFPFLTLDTLGVHTLLILINVQKEMNVGK